MTEDSGEKVAKPNGAKLAIGIASGKGGVGKSTTAVLLAQACAAKGMKVGIIDADITGPSVPRLLGLESFRTESDGKRLLPLMSEEGIGLMSINFLIDDEDSPVIWRGPLLSRAVEQFWEDTAWGELDLLVVDLPPGTGDVVITALTKLPISGVVFVSTPQDLVTMIVSKAVGMALAADAQILGLVENMGSYVCPECGKSHPLFAAGKAGQEGAARKGLPLLAAFPFRPEIAQRGVLRWADLPKALKDEAMLFADAALESAHKAASIQAVARKPLPKSEGKCEGCGCTGDCEEGCEKGSAADGCGCGA